MRILVVSAHYPPNFVSGGTLQPRRLARELARRGHDVHVYAGWFGDARPPLETWMDSDDGIPVRWIVTTPFTDWSSDANFDNPDITADFTRYLEGVRPDVVHFHALQSLGVGPVEVARDRGIRTVVTMHDFWWICGRQFLVDRSYRPCCLVVEAGVCECERGRAWLVRRTGRLRDALESVDLVLAPSASSTAVLEANGVAPDRLETDENGVPDTTVDVAPAVGGTGVEFVYAGGPDPMKGADVLAAALRLLADDGGWRLTSYGADVASPGLPVTVAPPYEPEELDDVLKRADVLVVPSVMRESHSLLTREALQRGRPVVCTDTLGPEEVVRHGVNGLVAPAGDAESLAAAMRRLVADRALLERLAAAAPDVAVRPLADQVEGLERRYVRANTRVASGTSVRRVLFAVGIEGAPLRYRVQLPVEALGLLGVRASVHHYRDSALLTGVHEADALVLYRVPATVQVLDLIQRTRAAGVPVFFDVDDLIVDPDAAASIPALRILPPAEASLWMEGVRRYRTTLEACDAFIGSTPALCRRIAELTGLPTERFDNGVGLSLGRLADAAVRRPRHPGPLRVGYFSGTDTHEEDWAYVEAAVTAVLDRHPDVELCLAGRLGPTPTLERFGERVRRLPFRPWVELPEALRDIDVNLAPLAPGAFNEAKSAIKWLEAALTATPSIVSPTEPFLEAVDHDVNGLVAHDREEWAAHLDRLLSDASERARLGSRARRDALLGWSPHLQGRRYLAILERGRTHAEAADARPRSGWAPVALDEPWIEQSPPVEPYDPGEWRRWARRKRLAPANPRRLASLARSTAIRARSRLRGPR